MIQAKCIDKIRDKHGAIVGYILEDIYGHRQECYADALKQAIHNNQVSVINLTLTSDGRLVSKEPEKQLQNTQILGGPMKKSVTIDFIVCRPTPNARMRRCPVVIMSDNIQGARELINIRKLKSDGITIDETADSCGIVANSRGYQRNSQATFLLKHEYRKRGYSNNTEVLTMVIDRNEFPSLFEIREKSLGPELNTSEALQLFRKYCDNSKLQIKVKELDSWKITDCSTQVADIDRENNKKKASEQDRALVLHWTNDLLEFMSDQTNYDIMGNTQDIMKAAKEPHYSFRKELIRKCSMLILINNKIIRLSNDYKARLSLMMDTSIHKAVLGINISKVATGNSEGDRLIEEGIKSLRVSLENTDISNESLKEIKIVTLDLMELIREQGIDNIIKADKYTISVQGELREVKVTNGKTVVTRG